MVIDVDFFTSNHALRVFAEIAAEFWQPPKSMARSLRDRIFRPRDINTRVQVSGETENIAFYLTSGDEILVISPFKAIQKSPLISDLDCDFESSGESWLHAIGNHDLARRVVLPRVLLVNPCVLENFPVPRLSLSVGLLASYLRMQHKADVEISDMQIGLSLNDVVEQFESFQPDLVGVSVSYGQKHLAFEIAEAILQTAASDPLLVFGNILPASDPSSFLTCFPDSVIAAAEGEETLSRLVSHVKGDIGIEDVPGVIYRNRAGSLIVSPAVPFDIETLPLPAFDTIPGIAKTRGALTLEISRGCQWNVCTFCPRDHKSSSWKTFSTDKIVDQFTRMHSVAKVFSISPHIYLADEEFIGGNNDGSESKRMTDVALRLREAVPGISFDAAARVDQVYVPDQTTEWHHDRIKMWDTCSRAGMHRLFMGIESGSDTQLKRYGKGIRSNDSVMAIRILTSLGIPLRYGFITFDQLMMGLTEIRENIAFLERTDAFLEPVARGRMDYKELFKLIHDEDYVREHSVEKPIYSSVSYMLASMEVLINSPYARMLQTWERRNGQQLLDPTRLDPNMGRYSVDFADPDIGAMSDWSQRWIDRNFGVAYAVKSLYKVASKSERGLLLNWMVAYRAVSLKLLKSFVRLAEEARSCDDETRSLRSGISLAQIDCQSVVELHEKEIKDLNNSLVTHILAGRITDGGNRQLTAALDRWDEKQGDWRLINAM